MTEGADFMRAQAELAAAQARLELLGGQRDELRAQAARLTEQLDRARDEQRDQAVRLGRLDAERDQLQERLAEREREGAEEAEQELARLRAEYEQAAAEWQREREQLQARVQELERPPEEAAEVGMTPTQLANRFADVLQQLAEGSKPAPGQPYSAALTGLEVEAKGVLQAPGSSEEEPTIVTADVKGVDPAQLSTMRMTFRLLPQLAEPEAPSGQGEDATDSG
jgi:colicin import membrane protein